MGAGRLDVIEDKRDARPSARAMMISPFSLCPEARTRKEKPMRARQRWVPVGLGVLLGLVLVREVAAWGDAGHQMICEIAFQEL